MGTAVSIVAPSSGGGGGSSESIAQTAVVMQKEQKDGNVPSATEQDRDNHTATQTNITSSVPPRGDSNTPSATPTPTQTALPPSKPLSKRAQKRQLRLDKRREAKRARKAAERTQKLAKLDEKRRDLHAHLQTLPEEEREAHLQQRRSHMRALRERERASRDALRGKMRDGGRFSVCVDMGWNEAMMEKEVKSLCRQLTYCYNAVRKYTMKEDYTPVKLSFCGVDAVISAMLDVVANGWRGWPVVMAEGALEILHEKSKIVYLTHDAEEVLDELSEDEVYVIGGIVDRNRLKGATMEKARRLGVRACRLNLDDNVTIAHGTPVLTVNHCVEILMHRANGVSWRDSYFKVLPSRKGLTAATAATAAGEEVGGRDDGGADMAQEDDGACVQVGERRDKGND